MSTGSNKSKRDETAIAAWQSTTHWMARTIAVCLLMIVPGVVGSTLDKRWGTNFLAITGFVGGMALGTFMLIILLKQFAPPARGKPLQIDDENNEAGSKQDE
ncbi:MAG: hypothetical protein U0930_14860 [Pirellulales bacterium]